MEERICQDPGCWASDREEDWLDWSAHVHPETWTEAMLHLAKHPGAVRDSDGDYTYLLDPNDHGNSAVCTYIRQRDWRNGQRLGRTTYTVTLNYIVMMLTAPSDDEVQAAIASILGGA